MRLYPRVDHREYVGAGGFSAGLLSRRHRVGQEGCGKGADAQGPPYPAPECQHGVAEACRTCSAATGPVRRSRLHPCRPLDFWLL